MPLGIRYWLPLAFVITALFGTIFIVEQQNLRQNANDPQIQISEDIAARLSENPNLPPPASDKIDIANSLNTYIIVYNDKGEPVFLNAKLDGQTPKLPSGVFDYVRSHNQTRITWQPKQGVRIATVITRYTGKSSGFVLVGRSLREVERRVDDLTEHLVFAWVVTLIGSLIASILFIPKLNRKK
jgi:hypothetical protein